MNKAQGNPEKLRKYEMELTLKLNKGGDAGNGVIGGSIPDRAPVQPASMIYWSALTRWNILHPRLDGAVSSRSEVQKRIASNQSGKIYRLKTDDDELSGEERLSPFVNLPDPSKDFLETASAIDFNLSIQERKFLRSHLASVKRTSSASNDGLSLFANLAGDEKLSLQKDDSLWSEKVLKFADFEDKKALIIAKQVASLSAIGRAVYAALVEIAKNNDNSQGESRHHDHLLKVVDEHRVDALALDIPALKVLVPALTSHLEDVLRSTQDWLCPRDRSVFELFCVYRAAENKLKGTRSRLDNSLGGKRRREEWSADNHPLAEPLHFRWENVCRLLNDLNQK